MSRALHIFAMTLIAACGGTTTPSVAHENVTPTTQGDVHGQSPADCRVARATATARADVMVPIETRDARFAGGDAIHIDEVRGPRDDLAVCETYRVKGHYTLKSHPRAELALYVTNGKGSGEHRSTKIDAGDGTFELEVTIERLGWPHLSIFPVEGGDAFGITYFGRGPTLFQGNVEHVIDRTSR
jgi:hypothetical protein